MSIHNTPATAVSYPWSEWDLTDPVKVFATCPNCDWRLEVSKPKTPIDFFRHYDTEHLTEEAN